MADVEPRVAASLAAQLQAWRAALEAGAERVGWKIGLNIPEVQRALGLREPVIGHLTSATRLPAGATYRADPGAELRAEAEVALEIGADGRAVAGYGAALELVDVARPPGGLEGIVAENVFHRAYVLAPSVPDAPDPVEAELAVNGRAHRPSQGPEPFDRTVELVARHLAAAGERLEPGDRIIAGSVVHVPVVAGDVVELEMGPLGRLALAIAP